MRENILKFMASFDYRIISISTLFSGGQKKIIALSSILVTLDEATNSHA
jgi:energy-coupling factor transporter ATP-binding protein EcfA2